MTAKELIANIRGRALGAGASPRDLFNYLADQVYEARLADGQRLLDGTDFKAWLRELATEPNARQVGATPMPLASHSNNSGSSSCAMMCPSLMLPPVLRRVAPQ
jgi:hypothetical protein